MKIRLFFSVFQRAGYGRGRSINDGSRGGPGQQQ